MFAHHVFVADGGKVSVNPAQSRTAGSVPVKAERLDTAVRPAGRESPLCRSACRAANRGQQRGRTAKPPVMSSPWTRVAHTWRHDDRAVVSGR